MKRQQLGMATVAFAVLIMSALGLLALGLVKAQWLGEVASGAQKSYSLRLVEDESAMVKIHTDLNNQELRKTLFDKDECKMDVTTSRGTTTHSCNSGAGRVSQTVSIGQLNRTLKILDMLLSDIPLAPLVSGRSIQVTGHSTIGNQNGVYVAMAAGGVKIDKEVSQLCTAPQCQVIESDANFSKDPFALYFDALEKTEIHPVATEIPPVPGMGLFHWIDGNLALADGEYGTPISPLLLVVNGTLTLSRRTIINGVVIVLGEASVTVSEGTINGALAAAGEIVVADGATVIYSNSIIQSIRNTAGPYVEVQGSWRDF